MEGETIVQADVINFYKSELKAGRLIAYSFGFTSLVWIIVMVMAHSSWEQRHVKDDIKGIVAQECREQIHQAQMSVLFTQ